MAITEYPLDSRGVRLQEGQLVTITPTPELLVRLNLFSARLEFMGCKFVIRCFTQEQYDGQVDWYAYNDDHNAESCGGYRKWPALALTGESAGLKGLVQRYKNAGQLC